MKGRYLQCSFHKTTLLKFLLWLVTNMRRLKTGVRHLGKKKKQLEWTFYLLKYKTSTLSTGCMFNANILHQAISLSNPRKRKPRGAKNKTVERNRKKHGGAHTHWVSGWATDWCIKWRNHVIDGQEAGSLFFMTFTTPRCSHLLLTFILQKYKEKERETLKKKSW